MLRDVRFAFRVLLSRPLFTLVAAVSLALGIGANSAIFSLVDAFWFRPLAVPHSGDLVRLFSMTDQDSRSAFSYPEFLDLQRQATKLSDLVAIGGRGATLVEGDARQLHNLNLVSSNFFTALGVKAALGRVFTPEDEARDPGALVLVLGNAFWVRHYGADPNIIGKQIHVQRQRELVVTIIGVLPASFREITPGNDRDMWFPHQTWGQLGDQRELEIRGNRWFRLMGRLAPGASAEAAAAQAQSIAQRMAETWPQSNRGRRMTIVTDFQLRMEEAGTIGLALLGIVLLVVVISSVNVANLLLSRAGVRAKEMAVRLAIGAGRGRLLRQLMVENTLLGLAGLALGLVIGNLLVSALPSLIMQPPGFELSTGFQFDQRVLGFTTLVAMATILLLGVAPAWRSSRPDLVPALKGESAGGIRGRWWPLRNWLVVAQVAVSLTLIASASVLIRSFSNTRTKDLGFGRKPILLVWLSADAKPALYRDVMSRFQGLPGVRSVAAAVRAPLSLSSNGMFQVVTFPGRTDLATSPPFEIKYNSVTANFLSTMGTPIVRGRGFERGDEQEGANSVLVNERMAERFWPGENPIGKTIAIGSKNPRPHIVVGVVKNAPINAVGEPPEPYVYLSYWANFETEITFMVETAGGDPTTLAQAARQELKAADRRLDPLTITTENELIRYSAQSYQMTAELVSVLGVLGLILTAVGLYGVVSYGVTQRTRELGIRMALGAARSDTLWLVLREVALMGAVGLVVGLPLALWATRMFSALLFGVGPWDMAAFAIAMTVLVLVLLAAGLLPARRATGIDPAVALHSN
jgi:predicted permease